MRQPEQWHFWEHFTPYLMPAPLLDAAARRRSLTARPMPTWNSALREQKPARKLARGTTFGTVIHGVVDAPVSMRFFCYLSLAMFAMFVTALVELSYANTERIGDADAALGADRRQRAAGLGRARRLRRQGPAREGRPAPACGDTRHELREPGEQRAGLRAALDRQRVEVTQQIDAARLEYKSSVQQINQQIAAQGESRGLIDRQIQDQKRIVDEYGERRARVKQLLDEQVVTLEQYNQVNTQYLQAGQAY